MNEPLLNYNLPFLAFYCRWNTSINKCMSFFVAEIFLLFRYLRFSQHEEWPVGNPSRGTMTILALSAALSRDLCYYISPVPVVYRLPPTVMRFMLQFWMTHFGLTVFFHTDQPHFPTAIIVDPLLKRTFLPIWMLNGCSHDLYYRNMPQPQTQKVKVQ